jgi:tripartite-type tricarboxylate transporter receptor subunit TctC
MGRNNEKSREEMHVTRNIARFATAVIAVIAVTLAMGTLPTAAAFPDKPIRFIVGFPPGGSSDAMARIVQQGLEKQLGQTVVIENKPGAGAMIGIDAVAKSAPDGYTIGLGGAGAFGTNLAMGEKMPYDPHKDIVPVTGLAGSPFILAAAPSLKGKSLRDIIAMAKSDPDKLAIGHGGNGTGMHLTAELINQMAGTKIALVPYRGMAPVLNDLIGSHIALGITDPPSAMAAMEAGKIETVAISSAKRVSRLPNIPTLDESGLPGFESNGSFGIVAPAGTPSDVIAKLNDAFVKVLKDPEIVERIRALGSEPMPMTPAEFGAYIARDLEKWANVVKAGGGKAN